MKTNIKYLTLLVFASIIINMLSFCTTVYASASVGPGVAIPFSSLPQEEQDGFLKAVIQFLKDIFNYTDTPSQIQNEVKAEIEESLAVDSISAVKDDDGNITQYIPNNLGAVVGDAITVFICKVVLRKYSNFYSSTHVSSGGGTHGGGGSHRVSAGAYNTAVSEAVGEIQSYSESGTGSSTGVSTGLELIDGVPHNSITVNQDYVVSVFDNLDFEYVAFSSIDNIKWEYNVNDSHSFASGIYFTPFFIDLNNHLYTSNSIYTSHSYNTRYIRISSIGVNNIFGNASSGKNTMLNFGFTSTSDHLYYILAASRLEYLSYYDYIQSIFGSPEYPTSPLIFDNYKEFLGCPSSVQTTYSVDSVDVSLIIHDNYTNTNVTDTYLLSQGIKCAGYFTTSGSSISSSNLSLAASQIIDGDNVISGGEQIITSELTDWQKAIYILAQQQGTTYEELLSKLDLIIDSSGTVTLAGLDGVEYSISELASSFDDIYSKVEDISGDLSELLEYLKSLNLEGLESHIAALESTLGDINDRDKEREAVYGDILGKLDELNDRLGSLNLDDVGSIASDISEIKGMVKDFAQAADIDISLDDFQEGMDSSFFIEKFPFSLPYDLYRVITLFVREPVEPVFTIPIKTEITAFGLNESIDEEITLDLTMFRINNVDIVRLILNFSITVGFVVMLIKTTTKLFV